MDLRVDSLGQIGVEKGLDVGNGGTYYDSRGVIHIYYLYKGKKINDGCFSNFLDGFNIELNKERLH